MMEGHLAQFQAWRKLRMEGWAKFANTIELLMDKALEYKLSWEVPSPKSLLCIAIALSVKYQITAHRLYGM